MTLWRSLQEQVQLSSVEIKLVAKPKWLTIESEYWLSGTSSSGTLRNWVTWYSMYSFQPYCIAGNFRQRKISSKAIVRQFVRNLFSSNAGRRSFALRSLYC